MDHRYNKRFPLSLEANIKTIKGYSDILQTRDVSTDGMCIESEHAELRLNEVIHITLSFDGGVKRQYKLKGMVVHVSDERAGVMFLRDYSIYINDLLLLTGKKNVQDSSSLKQFIYGKTPPSVSSAGKWRS